jgi:putative addiction module component (TIGR02574 family)
MDNVLEELERLTVAERLQIVEDLWDSIARSDADMPVPKWQKDELERRKQNYLHNPALVQSWDAVKREVRYSP